MPEKNADYFRNISVGDVIALTNEGIIQQALDAGSQRAMEGMELVVKTIRHIKEKHDLFEWILYNLQDEDTDIWLMAKIVDDVFDLRIYHKQNFFEEGTRADLLENECFWLFIEPDDPDDFIPSELDFTKSMDLDGPDDKSVHWEIKGDPLFGILRELPVPSGMEESLATVVEYNTDDDVLQSELLLLESGGFDEEKEEFDGGGGWIELFAGEPIHPSDIEVLKTK